MKSAEKPADPSTFHPWGFWLNGVEVHVSESVKNLHDPSLVVAKRDSHGELTYVVVPTGNPDTARKIAIMSFNLGFHENNTSTPDPSPSFWFVLQQWLEWKKDHKPAILGIRVWFSDGRVEDVGAPPS